MRRISYAEFAELRTEDTRLLDVREAHEFAQVRVRGAEWFPLSRLQYGEKPEADHRTVYVICRSGARSQTAGAILMAHGFAECVNVDGGTLAAMAMGPDHVEYG
jgi:rhodanese-related sulfurtransferase